MDSRKRTFLKAILWNLLGLAMMAGVGFVMTGSLSLGGQLALINATVGLISYVLYERLWASITWGRNHG